MAPVTLGYESLRTGRRSLGGQLYLLTTVTWQRRPYFANTRMAQTAMETFAESTFWLPNQCLCWVLMPDHWHGLICLDDGQDLSRAAQHFKGASARQINARLGRCGRVWAKGFHDHALRRDEAIAQVARYILANPLRAGLVTNLHEYPYLDQRWKAGLENLDP